jgi:uncharacterized protein YdeI (YjbR/CyaY-like superfamily)
MKKKLHVTDRQEWRAWLEKNHAMEKEVWLIYFKKHTGNPRIPYDDAVEEALCFGWIDSIVSKIDEDKYCQKFTPRKEKSSWSELNKKRVERLIKQGRMTEIGLAKIETAKKNGAWNKTATSKMTFDIPIELEEALSADAEARTFFYSLSPSYRKQYIGWIAGAKKKETRKKRTSEAVKLLNKNQKLGMK